MIKRKLILAMALAAGLSLQGCDSSTVAFGAGVVGGAILSGAIHHRHHNGYYYRGPCYQRYDGYYYCHNSGRWDRGYRWYNNDRVIATNVTNRAAVSPAAALSDKYTLSEYAAHQVVQAFERTKVDGNIDHLRALGLSKHDVKQLTRGESLDARAIQNMAITLRTDVMSVYNLTSDVASEYSLQKQHDFKLR